MRARKTQIERSEETRARIIAAAIEVLVSRGYSGLRIAEVAEVAEISGGGLLHHFATKDELIKAALSHVFSAVRRDTEEKIHDLGSDKPTPDLVVKATIEVAESFFFSKNFVVALDIVVSAGKDENLKHTTIAITKSEREPQEESWVLSLEAAGVDLESARDIISFIWSTMRGLATSELILKSPVRRQHVIDMLNHAVLNLISADARHRSVPDNRTPVQGKRRPAPRLPKTARDA